MVAQHLLLPDTATRRDLTDENLILDVAATIGTPERLGRALPAREGRRRGDRAGRVDAVAPERSSASSSRRCGACSSGARWAPSSRSGSPTRSGGVRDLLEREPEDDVERFVLRMPRGYFLSVEPARAARHFGTIAPDVGRHEVRSAAAAGSDPGRTSCSSWRPTAPGCCSWIAGALAVGRPLDPVGAGVHDRRRRRRRPVRGRGRVRARGRRARGGASSARRSAARSRARSRSIARVEDKRRHYPPPDPDRPRHGAPSTTTRSDFSTVIEVGAPDRMGLLYDITSALADLRLDVHLAKVATYAGRVDRRLLRPRRDRRQGHRSRAGRRDRNRRPGPPRAVGSTDERTTEHEPTPAPEPDPTPEPGRSSEPPRGVLIGPVLGVLIGYPGVQAAARRHLDRGAGW